MKLLLMPVSGGFRAEKGRSGTFVPTCTSSPLPGLAESAHSKKEDAVAADLCLNAHDIAAMPQLCHAKAARPAKIVQVGQYSLVMLGSAKLCNSSPAKGEVHACLQITACAVSFCNDMCARWK